MAETLVHEGQHVKLCGLLDMVPLVTSGGEKVYAPWRQDPRQAGGLLQGVYAHLGIARFWAAQRHAETGPDDLLRAQVHFARWRSMIDQAAQTLLRTDCLTPAGVRFVERLRTQGQQLEAEPLPADTEARRLARRAQRDGRPSRTCGCGCARSSTPVRFTMTDGASTARTSMSPSGCWTRRR